MSTREDVLFLQGDCRELLPTLAAESVHTVVTSPPYWGLRDYGHADQMGSEATPEEHVAVVVAVFEEVRRVLRKDGTLWLNYGDCYASSWPCKRRNVIGEGSLENGKRENRSPRLGAGLKEKDLVGMPWRVALALQSAGWHLRCDIIWQKPNTIPESVKDRPSRNHEYLFLLTKSPRYFYDADAIREPHLTEDKPRHKAAEGWHAEARHSNCQDGERRWNHPMGKNKRSVWEIPIQPTSERHFATFPEALVAPCIRAGTSEWGCCSECGAPWRRKVQLSGGTIGKGWHNHQGDSVRGHRGGNSGAAMKTYRRHMLGWEPTCKCESEITPCTVLDPFAGSGTVCKVATDLGRKSIGMELTPAYGDIFNRKNAQLGLLL